MGNRYGRNQRRAHRETIAANEAELVRLKTSEARAWREANSSSIRAQNAREEALRSLVQSGPMIKAAMENLGYELGRTMGPHFEEHVQKLKTADVTRTGRSLISFDAAIPYDREYRVSYIEGRIDALHYRVAVTDLWVP